MKTRHEVLIDAPRDAVWAAFDNPDNMPRWQPTLTSFTHKSGTPGQVGAISDLVYEENGRRVEMTETVTERREPDFMAGIYSSSYGKTIIVNHFEEAGEQQTRWVVYANHMFKGIMKLMGLFVARSIRNRTDADLERFKLLVETETAERNA